MADLKDPKELSEADLHAEINAIMDEPCQDFTPELIARFKSLKRESYIREGGGHRGSYDG